MAFVVLLVVVVVVVAAVFTLLPVFPGKKLNLSDP